MKGFRPLRPGFFPLSAVMICVNPPKRTEWMAFKASHLYTILMPKAPFLYTSLIVTPFFPNIITDSISPKVEDLWELGRFSLFWLFSSTFCTPRYSIDARGRSEKGVPALTGRSPARNGVERCLIRSPADTFSSYQGYCLR